MLELLNYYITMAMSSGRFWHFMFSNVMLNKNKLSIEEIYNNSKKGNKPTNIKKEKNTDRHKTRGKSATLYNTCTNH